MDPTEIEMEKDGHEVMLLRLFRCARTSAHIEKLSEMVNMTDFKQSWPVFEGRAPKGHPLPQLFQEGRAHGS